ncbi:MAG TPA: crotonase/enoyl-CoA hydratase family protein [Candidatus Limnocylindrales bacterium]|nr:crotonase/enoyl-CoA hydratase family protein [Candidatus Limnocylindrales bacterium]
MSKTDSVLLSRDNKVLIVTINRPHVRNAVDSVTAAALAEAFKEFEPDDALCAAVLTGAGGTFCAGADLREVAEGRRTAIDEDGAGPMGPTWLQLSKPVIAAVEGHAVAGGLELALWCDLRVAARDAVFGVFNRRFGVPLIDLGTVRLPRMIGQGRALDLILTGRAVSGEEALQMGLVNRLVDPGRALAVALELSHMLAGFPQNGLRADRMSVYEQWSLSPEEARRNELKHGLKVLASGESRTGAQRFTSGEGKHGEFARDAQWDDLLTRTRAKGKAQGVTSDADVERLSDEYRRKKKR